MRIAIIGASNHPGKFGNKAVRAYVRQGHEVFPVNPREAKVEGLAAYGSIRDVPGPIDRVLMYVPPEVGMKVVAEIAARPGKDVGEVWLNPGSESEELVALCERLGLRTVQACAIVDIGEVAE